MRKISVLVADDLTVRLIYQERLAKGGLAILLEGNKNRIPEKMNSQSPDLIIMDGDRRKRTFATAYPPCYNLACSVADHDVLINSDAAGLDVKVKMLTENSRQILEVILSGEDDEIIPGMSSPYTSGAGPLHHLKEPSGANEPWNL